MLTLTVHAKEALRALTPQAPESAGLRVAPGNQRFEFSLVTEPLPGPLMFTNRHPPTTALTPPQGGEMDR